ncbi:MAG: CCA tRNA nucleotidyltransferase [Octadecabacter sp.]|nr:CCA tRNA nucleotidyltransferase [Octadecabacter sp.]
MKISANWLNTQASKAVTGMLLDAEYKVYFVGGCVRNALSSMHVADLDLATNARPDVVMMLAKEAGLKVIPTGIDHGTVTVIAYHRLFEITTFRSDVETDGRHAVVAFSDTLEIDAMRRDFTINALYCAPDGTVIDPVGGIPDLHARHVRFINDADTRIREDFLRILRFFRFYAWFGDPEHGIDADGLAACAANLDGLEGLAKERIQTELIKTLLAPNPAPAMASMAMCGVLPRLLPGSDVSALAPLISLQEQLGRPANFHTRLAAINPGNTNACLRLSKADTLEFTRIRDGALSGIDAAPLGYGLGPNVAIEALMLRAALFGDAMQNVDIVAAQFGGSQNYPVKAKDLMPTYTGAALGARLKQLESIWIASGFTLTKSELLALL